MEQEYKYTYVKTVVFQANFTAVCVPGTLTTQSHVISIPGIQDSRFWLLGFRWNPFIYDYLVDPVKIFNYVDPLLGANASLRGAAGQVLGDPLNVSVAGASWSRNYLWIEPGINYDLINAPVYFPDTGFWFETHLILDTAYVPIGQVESEDHFSLTIGINK